MKKTSVFSKILSLTAIFALASCAPEEPQTRLETVDAMTETLSTVRDKQTADAAAEKFSALVKTLEKFDPVPAEDAALAEEALSNLAAQFVRIGKEKYFESDALKRSLGNPENEPEK